MKICIVCECFANRVKLTYYMKHVLPVPQCTFSQYQKCYLFLYFLTPLFPVGVCLFLFRNFSTFCARNFHFLSVSACVTIPNTCIPIVRWKTVPSTDSMHAGWYLFRTYENSIWQNLYLKNSIPQIVHRIPMSQIRKNKESCDKK